MERDEVNGEGRELKRETERDTDEALLKEKVRGWRRVGSIAELRPLAS